MSALKGAGNDFGCRPLASKYLATYAVGPDSDLPRCPLR
jgi:hypothetical protein